MYTHVINWISQHQNIVLASVVFSFCFILAFQIVIVQVIRRIMEGQDIQNQKISKLFSDLNTIEQKDFIPNSTPYIYKEEISDLRQHYSRLRSQIEGVEKHNQSVDAQLEKIYSTGYLVSPKSKRNNKTKS
ncbi:MAG: hypothetical protein KDD52_00830 [Bdellovibrionales bacterium]|nr:hypothetical protein [Bdellovibrionales bacterium]